MWACEVSLVTEKLAKRTYNSWRSSGGIYEIVLTA